MATEDALFDELLENLSNTVEQMKHQDIVGVIDSANTLLNLYSSISEALAVEGIKVDAEAIRELLNSSLEQIWPMIGSKRRPNDKVVLKMVFTDGRIQYTTITRRSIASLMKTIQEGRELSIVTEEGSDSINELLFSDIDEYRFEILEREVRTGNIIPQGGAMFPYYNISGFDLRDYMIYSKEDYSTETIKELVESTPCVLYALYRAGLPVEKMLQLKEIITNRMISTSDLTKICNSANIEIKLTKVVEKPDGTFRYDSYYYGYSATTYEIALYKEHYFDDSKAIPIHRYAVKNWYELVKSEINPSWVYRRYVRNNDFRVKPHVMLPLMMTFNFFEQIKEMPVFNYNLIIKEPGAVFREPIEFHDYHQYGTVPKMISFTPPGGKMTLTYDTLVFADFEAMFSSPDSKGHIRHIPCCISHTMADFKIIITPDRSYYELGEFSKIKAHFAEDCVSMFLNECPNNSLIYFHNLKYDFSFIYAYLRNLKVIEKDGSFFRISGSFYGKKLTFVDSYKLIPFALRRFPKTFKLQNIKKEVFPYTYFTEETTFTIKPPLMTEVLPHVAVEDRAEFIESVAELVKSMPVAKQRIYRSRFPKHEYMIFYCNQDVRILKEGFMVYREITKKLLNAELCAYLSASSLADQYMEKEGCYEGCFEISGYVREFIQRTIRGGRVMTNSNVKYKVMDQPIDYFDAVSLYPSAIIRLANEGYGYPTFIPELIESKEHFNRIKDLPGLHYYVEVLITKVGRKRHFSIMSFKDEKGIRHYEERCNVRYSAHRIHLEDIIKWHEIEYEFVGGYYFYDDHEDKSLAVNGNNNTACGEVMKLLFQMRVDQRKEDKYGPLQEATKGIMNKSYGKNGLKASLTEKRYFNNRELANKFIFKRMAQLDVLEIYPNGTVKVVVRKSILKHFNRAHIASAILAMSQRIMNEVMALAEDIGVFIYYQDTDSMFLKKEDTPKLIKAFKEVYGKELYGNTPGQFHCDFEIPGAVKDPYSVASIFLGKKAHAHYVVSEDAAGNRITQDHVRLKGVPKKVAIKAAETFEASQPDSYSDMPTKIMKLYAHLFTGQPHKFDFDEGGQVCIRSTDFVNMTFTNVSRQVQFREQKEIQTTV